MNVFMMVCLKCEGKQKFGNLEMRQFENEVGTFATFFDFAASVDLPINSFMLKVRKSYTNKKMPPDLIFSDDVTLDSLVL